MWHPLWIQPRQRGLPPHYTEWTPNPEQGASAKVLVISSDGRDGSATIAQDADIYRLQLQPGESTTHLLAPGRGLWLHVVRGHAELNGEGINPGDAASSERAGAFTLAATTEAVEALLFNLA